jgi:type I restriction enzyme S subunit
MAGEWDTVPLETLIEPGRGISYGIVQPGAPAADGVPIVRVSDVRDGRVAVSAPLRVKPAIEAAHARTRLAGGELLLTIVGTIGEAAVVPPTLAGWNVARAVAVIPVRNEVGARWVKLALAAPGVRETIDSRLNTTVQATLNLRDVARLPIVLPPLREREAIAHVLSTLDDKVELNRRLNETLEAIARALFKSWFVDFDPVRAKASGEPPESICRSLGLTPDLLALFPDRLVDSELGDIPEGWGIQSVGQVVERLSVGKKYEQKTVKPNGRVAVLDQGKSGIIGYHDDNPGVAASRDVPVVVFANHTCYMRLVYFPFSTIQNVLPFVGQQVDTIWLFFATFGKQSFIEYKGHWPDFVIQKLVVPDSALTKTFSNVVHPILKLVWAREDEMATLVNLRDTLLPQLISGELRVPLRGAA